MTEHTEAIDREDLEAKLREIEDVVENTARNWSMWVIGGLAVTAAVVIGVRVWQSRHKSITVEVYTRS